MYILAFYSGSHDASACVFEDYKLRAAISLERMSRIKTEGGRFPEEAINECLDQVGLKRSDIDVIVTETGRLPYKYFKSIKGLRKLRYKIKNLFNPDAKRNIISELKRCNQLDPSEVLFSGSYYQDKGFREDVEHFFFNHHSAHALPALFFNRWDDALIYTSDGSGDCIEYSHRVLQDKQVKIIYGEKKEFFSPHTHDSLAYIYGYATQALGFKMNRHEGKLTGLAAYGKPVLFDKLSEKYTVKENGRIISSFNTYKEMRDYMFKLAETTSRENVAASVQKLLEEKTLESIKILLSKHKVRNLGVAGGAFANVRLNQRLKEELDIDKIFIYPAMGDDGLCAGGVLEYLLQRDGLEKWLDQRYELETMYLGRDYSGEIDDYMKGNNSVEIVSTDPINDTAKLISKNKIVGLYTERMEFGPRALGARSIIASPTKSEINQSLNDRLNRTEFMPFAPVVLEEDSRDLFEVDDGNAYAMRFMTITCNVREEWRDKIPAVVHVDGTARPQIITEEYNPTYYNILRKYKELTGLPAIINTSFNAHEEPIINTPKECLEALLNDRVDYITTSKAVYKKKMVKEEALDTQLAA